MSEFPIVGIGASAGGLEALGQFFENMPNKSGMAFVIVQHLDPNHISIMPELLEQYTGMKVRQATDGIQVLPNNLYVIPPNKSMSILHGKLYLFAPTEIHGLRLPVDIFLRSLALDKGEKSIGLILSGMGSDGSQGLKAIKEKNGIAMAQDPALAKFNSMPRSACEAVNVDIIASAKELPARLIAFLDNIPTANLNGETDNSSGNLDKIIALIREKLGYDFSMYKKNMLSRRIDRRKNIHHIEKTSNYVGYLKENPSELVLLHKELMIGVTNFFRDVEVWKLLKEEIIPKLINESAYGTVFRAWVTACSTGEEAYSLAIVFNEVLEKMNNRNITLKIFATDLDKDAINRARFGQFSNIISADVSPERLSKFFNPDEDGFCVKPFIRDMIVFAFQNAIKDPPFTKIDLLFCRNLLIYFEPRLQKKMISLFQYAINPDGILILGTSENAGDPSDGFDDYYGELKIFKRNAASLPSSPLIGDPQNSSRSFHDFEARLDTPNEEVDNVQQLTDQLLLNRYIPASVVINEIGDILYITGRTGKYLEPVAGRANWNIYAMARTGIRETLPDAIKKALQTIDPVIIRQVKTGNNSGIQNVNITIQRFGSHNSAKEMILIVFTDVPAIVDKKRSKTVKQSSTSLQIELETELKLREEDLQSLRTEMQTSQEELKISNEELISGNEELITSNEEMQSLNEELQMVNNELQNRMSGFMQTSNDMKNLLNSTDLATLFVDKELNIRWFSESVVHIIKIRNSDIGRRITDLVTDLQYAEIENHANTVLKNHATIETIISTNDHRQFAIRIMPYRTHKNKIEGLVLTFSDITTAERLKVEMKNTNDSLFISENRYRRLFESTNDGILILDAETGKIKEVNPFLMELLGYSKDEFIEKAIWEIGFLRDIVANKAKFLELQENKKIRYEKLPLETISGQKIEVEFISNVYFENNQKVIQCNIRKSIDQLLE